MTAPEGISGLLVIDKPAGPTSHDMVDQMRRLYSTRRVGHAGTLDPPATGILVIGLGRATRILPFLQALAKAYRATVVFGSTTTTQDATGSVVEERPCAFSSSELQEAAAAMVGEISQVPPMVSAVRVGGERLYVAARRGEDVERPARQVTVYDLDVTGFNPGSGGGPWEATIEVRCSSGTYIRTIAADLGERLGCGAHVRTLRRVSVGSLGEADAIAPDQLELLDEAGRRGAVLPMSTALRDFDSVSVSGEELAAVRHGRALGAPDQDAAGDPVAVLDPAGTLIAVYRRYGAGLRPAAVLI